MLDIFASTVASPLTLLEEAALSSNRAREKMRAESDGHARKSVHNTALILRHAWKLRRTLAGLLERKGAFEASEAQAISICLNNIEAISQRMGFSIKEATAGDMTEETSRLFEVITALPSADCSRMTVDKTIEPAVMLNNEIVAKGALQVLQPAGTGQSCDSGSKQSMENFPGGIRENK